MNNNNVAFPSSWDIDQQNGFVSACMPLLNEAYHAEASALCDDVFNLFLDGLEDNADLIDMIVSFKSWFAENSQVFRVEGNYPNAITVTVTAPAGAGTIAVALGASSVDESGVSLNTTARKVTVARLVKACLEHLEQVRDMFPKSETKPAQQTMSTDDNPGSIAREQASAISIKVDGGTRYYRIRAAWFTRYGAPVYPEVLQAAHLEKYLTMEPGEYPFLFPVDVSVKEKDGKKQIKVVKVLVGGA